ncbi:MAG TPA: hypothetical protein VMO26_13885 [Vicinamibacterales bacterium]|nr:hypothetical protein [Vicinamibacterales bacterium]
MLRYQQQFTFFDTARVDESIRYVNLSQEVVNGTLDKLLERIVQEVEKANPRVVIVDSFRTVAQAAERTQAGGLDLQYFVQQLAVRLTSWEATTFLVGEYDPRRLNRIRSSPSRTECCGSFKASIGIRWFARCKP